MAGACLKLVRIVGYTVLDASLILPFFCLRCGGKDCATILASLRLLQGGVLHIGRTEHWCLLRTLGQAACRFQRSLPRIGRVLGYSVKGIDALYLAWPGATPFEVGSQRYSSTGKWLVAVQLQHLGRKSAKGNIVLRGHIRRVKAKPSESRRALGRCNKCYVRPCKLRRPKTHLLPLKRKKKKRGGGTQFHADARSPE